MRSPAVVASALGHVAVLGVLVLIAHQQEKHQATQIVVVDKPKVEKPKPPPPPPEPPKIVHPPPKPAAAEPPAPAPTGQHAAPVALSGLELSNDDGPGIALLGPAPVVAVPESRVNRAAPPRPSIKAALEECKEDPTKPEPIFKQEIEYPASARANGVEGRLVLRLTVGPDGSVTQVEVVSSVEASLDAAAIVAAKKWRFKPALRCGKPVGGGVYTLARRFELGD